MEKETKTTATAGLSPEATTGGDSEDPGGSAAQAGARETAPAERTFTRAEVNKMIAAEKQKERKAAESEFQSRQAEADRLAKMQADERAAYEKEQAEKRAAEAEAELNAYRLRDEAGKLAAEQGIPLSLLDMMDFRRATAEDVAAHVGKLASAFNEALKSRLEEKLRQPPPQTHANSAAGTDDLQKKLQEAQAANDFVRIAYYTRVIAEQKKG